MQNVYTPEAMRAVDRYLIEQCKIPGLTLMERAAQGVFKAVAKKCEGEGRRRILILCGSGNNGGDGLVLLRLLHLAGYEACGVLLAAEEKLRGDAAASLAAAKASGCTFLPWEEAKAALPGSIVVDALFGTGLCRPVTGQAAQAIEAVNASGAYVIAVDIPSGIDGRDGSVQGCAIRAEETITFQNYKPGLLLFPGRGYAGRTTLHRIAEEDAPVATPFALQQAEDIAALLPPRPLDSHKGKNGRALLLAGCAEYTGAALLCAAAALRAGCGLLRVVVPASVKPAFSALPEAMCVPVGRGGAWDAESCCAAAALIGGQQAIGFGSGMGQLADISLLQRAIASHIPLVIDADGLNALSRSRELLRSLHREVILTPHPGEMARLMGTEASEIQHDPAGIALAAAKEWQCVVLLKGASTCISDGRRVVFSLAGNPGLAKGGSGDTLTGIITALLAQGLSPMNAACAGAFLLGASADTAYKILGNRMLMASDVTLAIRETIGQLSQIDPRHPVADAE